MLIYGFDAATATGVAFWDTDRPESSIQCTTLRTFGKFYGEKAYNLGRMSKNFIQRNGRPDYAAVESPWEAVGKNRSANALVTGNRYVGSIEGILGCYQCPFEEVPSATWRKEVYGFGKKAGWGSDDWKRYAKEQCEMMGIVVANADEAEAALICFWCGRKSKHVEMIRRGQVA